MLKSSKSIIVQEITKVGELAIMDVKLHESCTGVTQKCLQAKYKTFL